MIHFSRIILRINGWKWLDEMAIPEKCVICMAPHTSNWDFIWGLLFGYALNLHSHFLMKKEWFYFPMSLLMNRLGGIPVDRKHKTSLTETMTAWFRRKSSFRLAIAPEGTRKFTKEWKKGFYFIALKAQVPIALAFIDYKTKTMGIGQIFVPTGNVDADLLLIQSFYKNFEGKFSDRFFSGNA
ncbi:MAG: 1-acyl-sn-glycerol-3-phosphate acyltransferase [Microbacter sp.]